MNTLYSGFAKYFLLTFLLLVAFGSKLQAQNDINWDQSTLNLNGNIIAGITSVMYGPDGKLYVAEYPSGMIKRLTILKNSSTDYVVTNVENIDGIRTMADHNDDGSLFASANRQVTGLTVTGTAANPVLYVSSSDVRIGAGSVANNQSNGDVDLDTNSGVITRFTLNGGTWDVVDLVRGLPRSEENHATNGLEFTTINGTDYLIVTSGGFTNAGSPSANFVYTCEYALSGAVLSIDLDAINALALSSDNGRNYFYDLPTLDDPTRANVNGITDPNAAGYDGVDLLDPFGGNDGLNQAIEVAGGPVQIFSPGYRNAYDLTVTESGALYVTDNGANSGWGGFPASEGGGLATNAYDVAEPGSQVASGGELVNNLDHLELITTNLQTYAPGSFYGGHPNPVRANPNGAGLFTAPAANGTVGAVFRTLTYDPDVSSPNSTADPALALPANWPPVQTANPIEGDWRGPNLPNPDGDLDNPIVVWGTNTNGIDEYTATAFGGALKGNLLAGHSGGNVRRVQLDVDGTSQGLEQNFLSGIGGNVLGITCNSDTDIFPGTVWAGVFDLTNGGKIVVFEPAEAVICFNPGDAGYDETTDYDLDGYTNGDENLNGTDACNGGSQPTDFDKDAGAPLSSDITDLDDDADDIPDALDPFQLGNINSTGSDAFTLPISNGLFSNQQGIGGIFGLGMTGLMNNGDTGLNWLEWIDDRGAGPNPDDVLGGAPGLMTSHMTSGTAFGTTNTQEKGYQYGVQTSTTSGEFTVLGNLIGLTGPLRLYGNSAAVGGELGHFIGDGTQSNYIKIVLTSTGITALQEIDDIPQPAINVEILEANRPTSDIVFYFGVNPSNGQVDLSYSIDGGLKNSIGTITAQGSILAAIQQANQDLAVGFIGTSGTPGVELEGTWDFLNVVEETPIIALPLPNITRPVSTPTESINLNDYFSDNDGTGNLTYTVFLNTNPAIGTAISGADLSLTYPAAPAVSNITIRATDATSSSIDNTFTVTVIDGPVVLYRVNSGGDEIAAIDGGLNWEADTDLVNSQYLTIAGTNEVFPSTNIPVDASVDQSSTPLAIFASERFDRVAGAPNMTYSFPVTEVGNYEVRLYFANSFSGTGQPGDRIFDTEIEGLVLPLLSDLDIVDTYGNEIGTVISHIVKVTDGSLDVSFLHDAFENPLLNAIEILDVRNDQTPIYVYDVADQFSNPGEALDGSLVVSAVGGATLPFQYSASGLPPGLFIEQTNGQIGGTIGAGALAGSPYVVTVTVNDSDPSNAETGAVSFVWNIGSSNWVDKNENENYSARHECSAVQAGDKFFVLGGRETQTMDVYDYTTDTWTSAVATPFDFNHFQATEYQGLIWVIGAFNTNNYPNEVAEEFIWAFDPATNDWIQGPQIPAGRSRGSAGLSVFNNKFYLVAGNTNGHNGGAVAWFDEYDPATGVWTQLADAPRARDHFHSVVIGSKLYAAGGRTSDASSASVFKPVIAEVDVYDFVSNTWTTLPAAQNIPTPRGGAMAVNFNEKLVVIGGEVQNELVYGVNTSDALKVTEEYDPITQTWTRLSDLNFQRHGTQAIVSGSGIFVMAGSNALGQGNQKNMEYLGLDNPVGIPSASSVLSAPTNVTIADGASENIPLNVGNGNVGVFVTSMEITGPNAADFNIISGELTNQLLSVNSSQPVTVGLSGAGANRSATLIINYGNGQTTSVNLANFDNNLNVTNPGTQNNNEGDVVSLQIQSNGASTYSATGLPPTLSIDASTGLISGTVSSGGGNDGAFLENNGLLVIEAESGTTEPTWAQTALGGASGIIAGSNHLSNINGGTIPYEVTVTTPGVYRFNWRSFYSGASPTDENDNWLRFPNTTDVWFFGFKGDPVDESTLIANVSSATPTNIVFPKGSSRITPATTPNGAGSQGYFKVFRSGGAAEVYDWQALTSDFDPLNSNGSNDIYVWFVNPGTYTMELSERSAGHAIDKIALYKLDGPDFSDAQLTAEPESQRASGPSAADNSPYTVTVSVADGGNPPSTANTQFTWYIGQVGDPVANAEATPISGFIPLEVSFTGSNSTDDLGITTYVWDFKDGSPTVTTDNPVHTFTTAGVYEVELTVSDADGNQSTTTVTVTANDPATAGDIRINAGGPNLSFNGINWSADQYFNGGLTFENDKPIANTANDALFQSERYSNSGTLIYQIPVVAGAYNVNLHFAELFFGVAGSGVPGGIGSRVFNINIENGQEVITNYDIVLEAGGSATAVIENFENITVTDGNLTITLTSVVEFPKISGIEVLLPGNSTEPDVFAGDDRTITFPNTSLTLDGSATDPDGGAIVSYAWVQLSGPSAATFDSTSIEDPTVSDLIEGDYVFQLTATDDENDTAFDAVTITVALEPGSLLINSGGPSFTFNTEEWTADDYFNGGGIFVDPRPIENTLNDELYQTERFGNNGSTIVYEIPVIAAGDYNVDLHFAELYFGAAGFGSDGGVGSRVFNISVENAQVQIDNYDIFVAAGGAALTAVVEQLKAITVNDGNLTITLTAVTENPKISGIGVYETRPPEVNAGLNQTITLPTNTASLTGVATDPDGGAIVVYQWTQESGPSTATLTGETTADLVVNDLIAGDYVFRLTATDDENATGFDEQSITVLPAIINLAPTAVLTADVTSGIAPLEVNFTGSTSTDDVAVVTYAWDFMDGTTSSDADPVHTFTADGTYNVALTVTDGEGLTDTAIVSIVVGNGMNLPPTAILTANLTSGAAPLEVIFTGSTSTDDVAIVSYAWDFRDGTTSSDADPVHTFVVDGTYIVALTVTDGEGLTNTATVTIVVETLMNQAPTAAITANLTSGAAPLEVIFTGSTSTDDLAIVSYAWDFMDGTTSSDADPVHTFTVDGSYLVTLTVTDGEGLTNTATVAIVVGDGINQTTAQILVDFTEGEAPLLVQFDGSGSSGDVAVTSYSWDFGDDTSLSSAEAPQHIYRIPGIYTATLTVVDADGLTTTDSVTITVNPGEKMNIILESNPASATDGFANVLVVNKPLDTEVLFITLHDVGGRYISGHLPLEIASGSARYALPISNLRDGLYFIRVVMSQGESTLIKLMVHN